MQVHGGGTMAEIVLAERAVGATLMIEAGPFRRLGGGFLVVITIQLDPVTEIVFVIQGDAVFDCH